MYCGKTFDKESLELRNKLIYWRFKNFHRLREKRRRLEERGLSKEIFGADRESKEISNRVKQMLAPLWLVAGDSIKTDLRKIAQLMTADLKAQNPNYLLELEAKDAIRALWESDQEDIERENNAFR